MMIRYCLIFTSIVLSACTQQKREPLFEQILPEHSGIHFSNELRVTPEFNILNYMYFYNGGGVAVGDFNRDDLIDIYFTSNQEDNKLYLNKGNFQFKDVTEVSGVAGIAESWTTGVTTVDINADGLLDMYVSMLGNYQGYFASNQLFVNQGNNEEGIPIFKEESAKYGLNLIGFGTQAAFFDYDLDGDLDMYQLNHSVHSNGTFVAKDYMIGKHHDLAGDRLMKNEDGIFVDVTSISGIQSNALGYGLGIGIADLNGDGYPDIYVGNDFHEDDYLYLNNRDGTFNEVLRDQIGHTSRYSMGNDLADINNDGLIDIFSADMLPSDYKILKASKTEDPYHIYSIKKNMGYGDQYSRNTLQLNTGSNSFSEIGMYSKVAASDWSWSPLIADFDMDGSSDIFVSNGIVKRPNDLDYINYISNEASQLKIKQTLTKDEIPLIDKMPTMKLSNVMFHQGEELQFMDKAELWGLAQPSYSSGSAYADLDNDGDLDLVVNNTLEKAFIFKNKSEESDHNFIQVRLKGPASNPMAIGSKVIIESTNGKFYLRELYASRGFQSASTTQAHFGLGKDSVNTLKIIWPDGSQETLENIGVNQTIHFNYDSGSNQKSENIRLLTKEIANNATVDLNGLEFKHQENTSFVEFHREALIPHMQSEEGPALAVGDVNGDGLDDVYIGGAKNQSAQLFVQEKDGSFSGTAKYFEKDKLQEDIQADFVDVENDGDLDLVVLTGGNEFYKNEEVLQPKIYINIQGQFVRKQNAFNGITLTGGSMSFCDYDKDGDQDVFIGARTTPWKYGVFPDSYFLDNDGNGNYVLNVKISQQMKSLGMVKSSVWSDVDKNGFKDLVIAGEWFPITIFLNDGKDLKKSINSNHGLQSSNGFWNIIISIDVDEDQDMDLIAGNLGTNTKFIASPEHPMKMLVKDIDQNGKLEQLLYTHYEGEDRLFATKNELSEQLVGLKKRFTSYRSYSQAEQGQIFNHEELKNAISREVHLLKSGSFINDGSGKFTFEPLPKEAQYSTVNSILPMDNQTILISGNYQAVNTQIGKYDASKGYEINYNRQNSKVNTRGTLNLSGQIRDMKLIRLSDRPVILLVRNNGSLGVLEIPRSTEEH